MIKKLLEITSLKGWRKIKHLRKSLKSLFRTTSQHVFKGKNEQQKKQYVKQYLFEANQLKERVDEVIKNPPLKAGNEKQILTITVELEHYKQYIIKFTDQIERRLIKGEVIAAEEKVYSIFEEHTEWISKGKLNKKTELGHLVLITTDEYSFIVDYKVMEKQKDAKQVNDLTERIKKNFAGTKIYSHSFDKGFWSKDNYSALQQAAIQEVILPKRGRHNKEDKERESTAAFKKLRNAHSAVESNINMLEHHGLNRCMDKGLRGYKRCMGLSVVAYNLHILGNVLKAKELAAEDKREKQRFKEAA